MASKGLRAGSPWVTLAAEPGVDKKEFTLYRLHDNAPGSPLLSVSGVSQRQA
jgi:hypothetical protein